MKTKMIVKKVMGIALSAFMVFATMVPQQIEAYAAGEKVFSITIGEATTSGGKAPQDGENFYFKSATITGNANITSMTIIVDGGGISKDTIGNISDLPVNNYHQTSTWVWTGNGMSVGDVQSILRSVKFKYATGMNVTVTVDGNKMNLPTKDGVAITSFSSATLLDEANVGGKVHYYMFVPCEFKNGKSTLWTTCYDESKSYYFMGMRGYLATITEVGEDKVLDKITDKGAWAGGARLPNTTTVFDKGTCSYTEPSSSNNTCWFWVDGPEAKKKIPNEGSNDSSGNSSKDWNADSIAQSDTYSTGYSNWRRAADGKNDEPNNSDPNGDAEWCLQVHYPDSTNCQQHANGAETGWNDLGTDGNQYGKVEGYFVEFSEYSNGMDPDYNENKLTTVKKEVNHKHNWVRSFVEDPDDNNDSITVTCDKTGCGDSYTVTVDAGDKTYDGNPYDIATDANIVDGITGVVDGMAIKVEYEGTNGTTYTKSTTPPTFAGEFKVIVSLVDGSGNVYKDNSNHDCTVTNIFKINKKAITVTAANQEVSVGDNIATTADKVSVPSGALATGESITDVSLVVGSTTSTLVNAAGTDEINIVEDSVVIKKAGEDRTANYTIIRVPGTLTAGKKALTVTTPPTVSDIAYGQKVGDSAITGTTAVVTDSSGNTVEGTWSWKEGSDDKDYKPNVGESQSKTWKLVFTPTDSSKYDPIEYPTKLTINPKPVSVTWSTDTYTYDGTDHIPTATVNTSDLVSGDTCTINVTAKRGGTDVDHPKYAGDYVATAVVSGNPNYIVNTSANTKNYSIGKKDITLTAPSESVAKDTAPTALDLAHINTNSGLVTGDTLTAATITHAGGANDYTVVGEHEISIDTTTVKIMSGSVDATGSYNITIVKGKLTVGKKAPSDAENHKPNVTITYGDKLGDNDVLTQLTSAGVIMDGGTEVKGHWEWDKDAMSDIDDKMPHVSDTNKTYPVVFVPEDTTNYSPYKTAIEITVNPKEIDVKWDKDSFEYNGNEQSPIPTAKDGELIGNDTVSFTVGGKQTNVGDNYTAQITSTGNPDYVVKNAAKTKGFKITPTSIDPSVNPNIKITVTYDANDDEVVKIFDTKTGKELVPYDPNNPSAPYDYKYEVTPNPNNNEYNDVKITGHGNYSGNASKLVQNMKYAGQIRSIIDLDASVAELNPKMNPVSDDNAYALVERAIDGQQELKDVNGKKISNEQKTKTKTILNEIKNSGTSTAGSFLAVVSLEMKGLEEDKVSKQDVSTIADMIKSESKLSGMVVGEYIDLSLFLQYRITPADTSVPEYVTQKIKIYDTTAQELSGHTFEQEVTVTIPQKLLPQQGHSRTYTVVRIHYPEGSTTPEKEILPTTRNGNNLTFKTGKFSTYAILYKDTVDPTPTPTPTPDPDDDTPAPPAKTPAKVVAPKTADTADLFVAFGMVFMGAVTLLGCTLANRRVNKKYRRNV